VTPRTVEQLSDVLAEDLAWRKKELAALRSMLLGSGQPLERHQLLLRAGLTLLYAHWEGFIRFAGRTYLEFVRFQRLTYAELAPNFLALAARSRVRAGAESRRIGPYIEVTRFYLAGLGERAMLPSQDIVATRANLSFDVFAEILQILGLDQALYLTKSHLIDSRLLHTRNTIAHGQYLILDGSGFEEVYREIIAMMDGFRNQVENAAASGAFRAA